MATFGYWSELDGFNDDDEDSREPRRYAFLDRKAEALVNSMGLKRFKKTYRMSVDVFDK